jgi:transposase
MWQWCMLYDMAPPVQEPLRELTKDEQLLLQKVAQSRTEIAEVVARAKSLLAVRGGASLAAAARAAGRKSGLGVARLVVRFNREGLEALHTKPGAGHPSTYTVEQRAQVLAEYRRKPDREMDGTGTWSLTTLQRAVRKRPKLEHISRDTISGVLHDAGLTWQRDRTWCETGVSIRKGKHGRRAVVDVDAAAKKG